MPPLPRRPIATVAVVALAAGLAGCMKYLDRSDTIAFHAGDANAANIALHTIDPWPRAAANQHIPADGERMVGAVERYKAGEVTQPEGVGTSGVEAAASGGE